MNIECNHRMIYVDSDICITCVYQNLLPPTSQRTYVTQEELKQYNRVRAELTPELRSKTAQDEAIKHPMYGHCHHASYVLYSLLGGKEAGYKLQKAFDENNVLHYWLLSPNGEVIDPTHEQYTDFGNTPPYENKVDNRASYQTSNSYKTILSKLKD